MIAKIEKILLMRPYIIIMLLVVLAFANTLKNSFIHDDTWLIVNNPKIDIPLKEMPSIFTTPMFKLSGVTQTKERYYRPIVSLFYILNYKIWGLNPAGYHLTGILIHLMSAIILYRIGLLLFSNNKLISLMAASIFAVHPVTSEPMGVATAGDIIYGFLIIMTLYFFLKERQYLSWFTFALAVFSKESTIILPFALIILSIDRKGTKKGIMAIMPYMALTALYLTLRAMTVDAFWGRYVAQSIFTQTLTMIVATADYVKHIIIPYPLSPFYPAKWYTSLFEPKVMIAITVLLLISLLAFRFRKDKIMLFLLAFPFFMLAPAIFMTNNFLLGTEYVYIGDRHLYVPLMSFPLFISACAVKLTGDRGKTYLLIGWLSIIIVLSGMTVSSNRIWRNDITLFSKIVKESPNSTFAHNNLGVAYANQGRLDEAALEYLIALKLKPDSVKVYYNLGNVYAYKGELDKAIEQYLTAIRLKPDYPEAHNNLGLTYYRQEHLNEAVKEYMISLKLQPDAAKTHSNIADVYIKLGEIDKGIIHYQAALRLKPDLALTHNNLGLAYKQKGLINEARQEFETALKIYPYLIYARQNLESLKK